ncbi:putative ribonuclease H-like domain-containing protein [Tanacetum coccineum]
MPIWKDASYFGDASPRTVADAQIEDKDDLHDENDTIEKSHDDSSLKDNGTADQQVNTAGQEINPGSREVSTTLPEANTATPEDLQFLYTPHTRIHKDHPIKHVIGDVQSYVQTRRMKTSYSEQGFLSAIYEGKSYAGGTSIVQTAKDERGIVIRNKVRLVAQGHTQEEGIDYDEVFAPVARIEAIRMGLAYASYMGFMVYQMDVKSAFLYCQIEEEVYVCQPPGFKDPNHPDKVYKVVKALYGQHQAPRAWYDTLANYLLCNGFQRGKIDQTLSIKRKQGHILLVQIYVDDIIFGSTKKELCDEFKKLMKDKFQMSSMGELIFFLGLQDFDVPYSIHADIMFAVGMCKVFSIGISSYTDSDFVELHKIGRSTTGASLRRHLKLDDHDGITSIPNSEIFEQLALIGYHTDSDNPNKTAWEQFSSNIAIAVICLATNRRFNFSRLIFEHMVSNISSPHKFLMYPRFIQICLDIQRKQLQQHSRTYPVPSLSIKVFNNIKRPTKGYSGQEVALFPTMLNVSEPSTSPSRITSSPSPSPEPSPSHSPAPSTKHSPDHTTTVVSFPSPSQPTQPSPKTEQHIPTPYDSPLHAIHSYGSDEGSVKLIELTNLVTKLSERIGVLEDDLKKTKLTYSAAVTKLILRVKKLETQVKVGKARKGARVVLFEDDADIKEVVRKGILKLVLLEQQKGTSSEVLVVNTSEENISTAGRTVTYKRRSEEERIRKDKGKAIDPTP